MKNTITLPGWGFSANSLKTLWPDSISLTCEDLFSKDQGSPLSVLKDIVDSFDKKPCTIIGWSLGGLIALDYCATYENHRPDLVLLCPTSNFRYENELNFQDLGILQRNLAVDRNKTLNRFYLNLIGPSKTNRADIINCVNQYREQSEMLSTTALDHSLNYLETKNISDKITTLKNSCSIIHGKKDNLIPICHSELIHKALPNSKFQILPNASHMLPYDNQSEILDMINKHALPYS